ncbi:hypothetical protein CEXT_793691 [Caerostris extrusa]|uniref:Uncharacterized protein n=1 Tax=Caerostris extrusa TaxID=172846 RepID=A0AAV4NGT2_CAEEX|nr:hypothetical protein CEXT_793691 [Caerostris extrusa]
MMLRLSLRLALWESGGGVEQKFVKVTRKTVESFIRNSRKCSERNKIPLSLSREVDFIDCFRVWAPSRNENMHNYIYQPDDAVRWTRKPMS